MACWNTSKLVMLLKIQILKGWSGGPSSKHFAKYAMYWKHLIPAKFVLFLYGPFWKLISQTKKKRKDRKDRKTKERKEKQRKEKKCSFIKELGLQFSSLFGVCHTLGLFH